MILLDLERTLQTGKAFYWKANRRGYTNDISEAGNYPPKEAHDILANDVDCQTIFIADETVKKILNES